MDTGNVGRKPTPFVCKNCSAGKCIECVDVLRVTYTDNLICKCRRKDHSGEVTDEQLLDPETGIVYAKALMVGPGGNILNKTWVCPFQNPSCGCAHDRGATCPMMGDPL